MTARPPIDGETRIYGILGHPVRHSLSPAMHNAAFEALGLNAVYLAFPVAPERLPEALAGLAAAEVLGLNLTVPHKTAVIPLLSELTPEARAIGAVNTIRHTPAGWVGTNTDGMGFMGALESDLHWSASGKQVLLLGAGGSARAVGWSLLAAGIERLVIANRTPKRAETLARDLAANPGGAVETLDLAQVPGAEPHLLVNTTTVGMGDGQSPVALAPIGVREAVVDIIYAPPSTPLLAQAKTLGLAHANGMGMLLHQGVTAFHFWTGKKPPVEIRRAALEAGLSKRES